MGAGSSTVRNANSGSARGIVAQGPLTIAAGSLVNRGNVSSNGDISLKITGLDNDAGVIGALGKLAVEGSSVTNRGGSLQARQGVDLHIAGGTVAVTASTAPTSTTPGRWATSAWYRRALPATPTSRATPSAPMIGAMTMRRINRRTSSPTSSGHHAHQRSRSKQLIYATQRSNPEVNEKLNVRSLRKGK